MRQSKLFSKTSKHAPKDEASLNAQLLIKAGFIDKLTTGIYSYLPLGYRVLNKIQDIIREEMNAIDGQEIYMPALTPKENWEKTSRWDEIDVMFKLEGVGNKEYALNPTHEEIVAPLVKKFINSYKDLPFAVYQIQDKFRNEIRAKAGLLRGREFSMKDLYSFHANEQCLDEYYNEAMKTYLKLFKRFGLEALVVEASGGAFTKYSHEYQVITEFGEDTIYFCECGRHQNKEIVTDTVCPYCNKERQQKKSIEVGNIFKLKTRFSEAFDVKYTDKDGTEKMVNMGCYGIGPSRVMGAIVEVHHDENGIIWPTQIAPYQIHLISLNKNNVQSDALYNTLQEKGFEVLYDDRQDSVGIKLNDSDLLGIPVRLLVSQKTGDKIEFKNRSVEEVQLITLKEVIEKCSKIY